MTKSPPNPRLAATRRGALTPVLTLLTAFVATATTAAETPLVSREEAALRAAAERVAESVVQIRTIGGLETVSGTVLPDGPTTGLVISADGYIISSAFNFVQQPASILVTFASGKQVPAELVATDRSRMIVLLKAAGVADLPVPEAAPPDEMRVGQWAVAVGRTFRPDRTNISVGIVSAVNRMFGKVLQTDADVSLANYGGPLVDLRGRVLGVIVPMAPQGASEVAGVEWYDSGIGFAVPLAAILQRIDQFKRGEDLRAGILGIGLSPRNPHSSPPMLAAVRPDGPAGKAGLKKGDRIVEVDGQTIRTQTDLRFELGTRYGGDDVKVGVERDDERFERTIELASELPAFRHAFLGILPMRPASAPAENAADDANQDAAEGEPADAAGDDDTAADDDDDEDESAAPEGIRVRMVYAGSPAEAAGVQVGDRILQINGVAVRSIEAAIAEMNNTAPGSEVGVQLVRGERTIDVALSATGLPSNVPTELPPAYSAEESPPADDAAAAVKPGETRDITLPELPQKCKIYVPASHEAGQPQGLVLWLDAGDEAAAESLIRQWQPICDRDGLLLVVPTPAEANKWNRTELDYLRRLVARVFNQYKIDANRIAVYGSGSGGALAWSLGLAGREVIRGLAVSAAPLPRRATVPANEPSQRFAIFAATTGAAQTALPFAQSLQKCADAGYPVSTITLSNDAGKLTESEREEFARWIDTLDRF